MGVTKVYSSETIEVFLQLVRMGVRNDETRRAMMPANIDWTQLKALADVQGLSAVVLDGLDKCRTDTTENTDTTSNTNCTNFTNMPKMLRLEWIGEVLQNYEARYKQYEKAIGTLAGWYNQHGFKMMVLKGYVCSLDWPRPEHRPCGDIDIWLFGQQKEADKELSTWFKVQGLSNRVETGHHHHTVFEWDSFTVENHYDFVNVCAHKSSREIEKVFKQLGEDDTHYVELYGEKVYLPSPNLHALFLIRHMVIHFVGNDINLRQLIDWAFFVKNHTKEIDWQWLEGFLEKYHMKDFFNCINAICVEDLGFTPTIFPIVQFLPYIKERVLKDIFCPQISMEEHKGLIKRLAFKYHRWRASEWKHKMCYKESMWSAFWSSVWAHLLKPKSI